MHACRSGGGGVGVGGVAEIQGVVEGVGGDWGGNGVTKVRGVEG